MTLEEGGAGRSGHASPWYALAGTCPESTCQLRILQRVNSWLILLVLGKTLDLYHVHYPVSFSAIPKTGQLCVNSASITYRN